MPEKRLSTQKKAMTTMPHWLTSPGHAGGQRGAAGADRGGPGEDTACWINGFSCWENAMIRMPPWIISPGMQAHSEELLEQTGEALEAQLSLEGVQDIRAMLRALDQGRALHPLHLTAVASTLLAARALEGQLQPE